MTAPVRRDRTGPPLLGQLTGLRFLAAMWVVGYHTLPRFGSHPSPWRRFWDAGFSGVTLFFVLSGFVLVYTYGPSHRTSIDARAFWAARVARLYPVYIVALIIGIPEFVRITQGLPGIPTPSVHDIVAITATTPLMVQGWVPRLACDWNCPSWTLSAEAFFYLLFPLLAPALVGRRARTLLLVAIGACAAMRVVASLPLLVPGAVAATGLTGQPGIFSHTPIFRLPEFLLGMALGRWYLDRRLGHRALHRTRGRIASLLAAMAVLVIVAVPALSDNGALILVWLAPAFAVLLLACAERANDGWLAWPRIVFLGEASYALYIIHGPVHVYVLSLAKRLVPGSLDAHPWAVFWCYLGTVLSAAVLLHVYVERPARVALRRRWAAGAAQA